MFTSVRRPRIHLCMLSTSSIQLNQNIKLIALLSSISQLYLFTRLNILEKQSVHVKANEKEQKENKKFFKQWKTKNIMTKKMKVPMKMRSTYCSSVMIGTLTESRHITLRKISPTFSAESLPRLIRKQDLSQQRFNCRAYSMLQ